MEAVLLKIIGLIEEHWFWLLIFGGTIVSILGDVCKGVVNIFKPFVKQTLEYMRPGHWGIQRGMTWEELKMANHPHEPNEIYTDDQLRYRLNSDSFRRCLGRHSSSSTMKQDRYGGWTDQMDRMLDNGYSMDELEAMEKIHREHDMEYEVLKKRVLERQMLDSMMDDLEHGDFDSFSKWSTASGIYDPRTGKCYTNLDNDGRYGLDTDKNLKSNTLKEGSVVSVELK